MPHAYASLMFTPAVSRRQSLHGAAEDMRRYRDDNPGFDRLGAAETAFIEARDSVYLATVSDSGWPYVQHRGGPPGFMRVLDERRIAWAEYRGNRHYLSAGHLDAQPRAALFFVDYRARRRLKLAGTVRSQAEVADADPALVARLRPYPYRAAMERIIVLEVAAFDWNCPQHLTPRWTEAELRSLLTPLQQRIAELEAELATLRAGG